MQPFSTINLDVLEAVNLYIGDNPAASLHLQIASMQLPGVVTRFVDHAPGGSPIEVEIPVSTTKLTAGFTLVGWTKIAMVSALSGQQTLTCWGLLREKRSGRPRQARAIIQGWISAQPDRYARGTPQSIDYAIGGIMHYDLMIGRQRVYYWDFKTQTGQVGDYGQSMAGGPYSFSLADYGAE